MQRTLAPFAALMMAGCASAPVFNYLAQSRPTPFGKQISGFVDPVRGIWNVGYAFDVPADGQILASYTVANPQVKLEVRGYAPGVPVPVAYAKPDGTLTLPDVHPGTYYLVLSDLTTAGSPYQLSVLFKPVDKELDRAAGPIGTQAGAQPVDLASGQAQVTGTVDYSGMKRDNYWKLTLPGSGALTLHINSGGAAIHAEYINPQGAPQKIDPTSGLQVQNLPAGDYYVHVYADGAGDAGSYTLAAKFDAGDICANGGAACAIDGAESLALQGTPLAGSTRGDVDYSKGTAYHWYKVTVPQAGKLTLNFKPDRRGEKLRCEIMQPGADSGDAIYGNAIRSVQGGDVYLRVSADQPGWGGKYGLNVSFAPVTYLNALITEIDPQDGCILTIQAGASTGVRTGAQCQVVNGGQTLMPCVVEQTFNALSKVRAQPSGPCKVPRGAVVQIPQSL